MTDITIIGAGSYGEVVAELAATCGYRVIAFYDDDGDKTGKNLANIQIKGKVDFSNMDVQDQCFALAIGNNKIRQKLSKDIIAMGGLLPSLIHPKSNISPTSDVGIGCLVHFGSCLWTNVVLGDFSIVSPNSLLAHHTRTRKAVFVSSGANIGANVSILDRAFLGIGSTVMTGVEIIGEDSIVGAGAVVIGNVDNESVYVGVPARKIR